MDDRQRGQSGARRKGATGSVSTALDAGPPGVNGLPAFGPAGQVCDAT